MLIEAAEFMQGGRIGGLGTNGGPIHQTEARAMTVQEKWILFSTCDEDSNSELRALDIETDDAVLCVTGSGCRTLSHLSRNPKSLVSVDFSPGQNYLLELKLLAIRNLTYDELLGFLGVDECTYRLRTFASLEPDLSPGAAAYFRRNEKAIRQGVLFSGRHEQYYRRLVAPALRLLYGRAIDRIFAAETLEEQRCVYEREIVGPLWRTLIKHGFSRRMIKLVLNDSKYKVEIDVESVSGYLLERLEHTFLNHLARDNDWLSILLTGRYVNRSRLPHFLSRESYEAIRAATTDMCIVTANLLDYLRSLPDRSISKFSLSDVTSCVARAQFNDLLAEVARVGADKGRLCYRNFLAKPPIPHDLSGVMRRDDEVCRVLDQTDMAFAYTFEVATIAAACGTRARQGDVHRGVP